jgi:hypothetical protein
LKLQVVEVHRNCLVCIVNSSRFDIHPGSLKDLGVIENYGPSTLYPLVYTCGALVVQRESIPLVGSSLILGVENDASLILDCRRSVRARFQGEGVLLLWSKAPLGDIDVEGCPVNLTTM